MLKGGQFSTLIDTDLHVHDLKHTFGRRLRAAGISYEDRQDLLGHRSGRITTHYSQAELGNLLEAANAIIRNKHEGKELTILRVKKGELYAIPTKSPQSVNLHAKGTI